jgi:hypothetical protein
MPYIRHWELNKMVKEEKGIININPERLKRSKPAGERKTEKEKGPPSVTAGAIEKIVDIALNPSRDKAREFTVIDRMQGRLLPQLDLIDLVWQYAIEIAAYRQDASEYEEVYNKKKPIPPNLIDEFTYRTAQWQKSIGGQNLKSAIDLALAETEARTGEEGDFSGADIFEEKTR